MRHLLLSVLVVSLVGLVIPSAFAENVPSWVKNTAGWWADDIISETEFVNAIEFLVKENIIQVDASQTSETSQSVPAWVKNNAGWWADDQINDNTFISGIQYLIKSGIIVVTQAEKSVTETTIKVSGYSDWLINNPSWEDAREFCNCPFDKFDLSYLKDKPKICDHCNDEAIINSHGFRSEEFSKQKVPPWNNR